MGVCMHIHNPIWLYLCHCHFVSPHLNPKLSTWVNSPVYHVGGGAPDYCLCHPCTLSPPQKPLLRSLIFYFIFLVITTVHFKPV